MTLPAPQPAFPGADARASAPRRIAVTAVPAPLVPLEAARAALPRDLAFVWEPPDGTVWVGSGAAARLDVSGAGRFEELRLAAQALWARVSPSLPPGAPAPRLFGGLAFAPFAADDPPWTSFGDASFTLPRLAYVRADERAWVLAAAAQDEATVGAELDAVLARLQRSAARAPTLPPPPGATLAPPDRTAWHGLVGGILAEIAAGRARKIVAARRAEVRAAATIDEGAVLRRLGGQPTTWRFAFARGGATFLGATPERLVRRAGDEVLSEALAGSVAAGHAGELLASSKDRAEHAMVVRAVADALAPLCATLDVPVAPQLRELRHLLHLWTPIRGRLRAPAPHVLELAAALHPTPAVGGLPRADALAWIAAHEPTARGWYAGPVGWFDAAGDGELVVALRSALVHGSRAFVYAGAGIVAGSDAARELDETGLKLRGMLGALGVVA
jgi:isochorismate synthase